MFCLVLGESKEETKYECTFYLTGKPGEPVATRNSTTTSDVIHVHKTVDEFLHQDITFLLNLDQYFFNVYIGGILVTRSIQNGRHSLDGLETEGAYTPSVGMQHLTAEISFVSNVSLPLSAPGKIHGGECFQKIF